jgi:hypothetical protein
MGVTLSPSSIPKIRQAIRDGENYRLSRGADRLPDGPSSGSFWALVVGMGLETPTKAGSSPTLQRFVYSFLRILPCADAEADVWLNQVQAYRFADTVAHIHQAIEINGRPTPSNEIVMMTFSGFAESTETVDGKDVTVKRPRFAFNYSPTRIEPFLPIHNHASNDSRDGGFSFSVYHPGTSLPQMRWGH